VYVVVSRYRLIQSNLPSVICAPVFSERLGISTQDDIGADEGLKHDSTIYCDQLTSLPKSILSRFVSRLGPQKMRELDTALAVALELVT
jgi:mRNA interferase MazF